MDIQQRIDRLNWNKAADDMNNMGYAILPGVLSAGECDAFISQYDDESLYRKKVIMERHQYGEYKYFSPLPQLIQQLRETVYPKLVPIVNGWMQALNIAASRQL